MSLTELRPVLRALPRHDRFLLAQELLAELAQEECVQAIEYPVWSPYDAHDAAATLLQLLEREKANPLPPDTKMEKPDKHKKAEGADKTP